MSHLISADPTTGPTASADVARERRNAQVRAKLQSLLLRDVIITTASHRYQGRLLSAHTNVVWLELRDDCMVAVTESVLAVDEQR